MNIAHTAHPAVAKSLYARRATWLSYLALLLLMVVSSLPGFLPENSAFLLVISIKLVPLLIVLPGLLKDVMRSYAWLCFVVLLYFTQGVVELFLSQGAWMDIAITFFSVSLFLSAMFYIKWQKSLGRSL